MAEPAATRDALLADVGRALRSVRPDRAEGLLQELEYATGRDPRPVVERTVGLPPGTKETVILAALLAAANAVEARLPWGRRVTWRVRVTPIVDTTVVVLGVEAEPIDEVAQAAVLASFFALAFAPELTELVRGDAGTNVPPWFFPRLRKLAASSDLEARITAHIVGIIAPGSSSGVPLPAAPARYGVVKDIAPALRECFPGRAEAILDEIWSMLVAPNPRAKAIRHDGGTPGSTPRELALQIVELMNAVELEQPAAIRATWTIGPAPLGAVDVRGAAA